jgi:PAS domain S-box-containing protein
MSNDGLSGAYLRAALDCVVMADASGRIVEFNPAAEQTFGYAREEAVGKKLAALIIPLSLRDAHEQAFTRFVSTGKGRLFGKRLELMGMRADGSEFPIELALSRVEGEPLFICAALRDLSEAKRTERDLRQVVAEQAGLRRVATLVAEGSPPADVFAAVAEEVGHLLDVPIVQMSRYASERTVTIAGTWGEQPFPPGSTWPLDGPTLSSQVLETGRPARIDDYTDLPGTIPDLIRQAGVRSGVGAPVVVNGELWGVIMALSTDETPLPPGIEDRLLGFTELVATAIANSDARADLERIAEEQAALRRVAVMVAEGAPPEDVFATVAEQVGNLLGVPAISMVRFDPDETSTAIAVWGEGNPFGVGTTFEPWPGVMLQVRTTARPARLEDFAYSTGPTTARLQAARIHSGVGVPIIVDGRVWGTTIALATGGASLPTGIEERLGGFTDLVATAIANTQARDELRSLLQEQAALRRVATLVAEGAEPHDVFAAVAEEIAHVLAVPLVGTYRYESDGTATVTAGWGDPLYPVGSRLSLEGQSILASIRQTGQPAKIDDYSDLEGEVAEVARKASVHWAVGVPIVIDGRLWGAMTAASTEPDPTPSRTEERLSAFTELAATAISNTQVSDDLHRLADEQGALRRVATLVAQGTQAHGVFDAVCAETGRLLGATSVNLAQFTTDGFNLAMAGWSMRDTHIPTGTRMPLEGETINVVVWQTGAPGRFDSYEGASGRLATLIRERGIASEVGAPVIVAGEIWGALIAGWDTGDAPPPGIEFRLANFAELVATAVSNATAYSELINSRARIVAAGDEARRRIERNLHDGTQSQLVSVGLDLQALKKTIPPELEPLRSEVDRVHEKLASVTEDVREISRGLHPALLSRGGLDPALRSLARKAPLPVELHLNVDRRLPQPIETATYFVVSEALANAAKHASASTVRVSVRLEGARLRTVVSDDGQGGAVPQEGSGLTGLIDRVEALGGRLTVVSPPGGTTISVELGVENVAIDTRA